MITPRKVRKDQKITAKWANSIVDAIVERTPRPGTGYVIRPGTGGFTLRIQGQGGGHGASAVLTPLSLVDASDKDGAKIRIVYGTIGNQPIAGMSPGDNPPYVLPVSGASGFVWAVITTDDNGIVDSVTADLGAKVPSDEDTVGYLVLGSYSLDASKNLTVASALAGSQQCTRCRNWFSNPATYSFQYGVL